MPIFPIKTIFYLTFIDKILSGCFETSKQTLPMLSSLQLYACEYSVYYFFFFFLKIKSIHKSYELLNKKKTHDGYLHFIGMIIYLVLTQKRRMEQSIIFYFQTTNIYFYQILSNPILEGMGHEKFIFFFKKRPTLWGLRMSLTKFFIFKGLQEQIFLIYSYYINTLIVLLVWH